MKSFLFKEFLLKRVISGHKTETRRSHGLETVNKFPSNYILIGTAKNGISGNTEYLFSNKTDPKNVFFGEKKTYNIEINCKPKYNIGDVVYLKENYTDLPDGTILYQMDIPEAERKNYKWKSKLMMPASKARHFVKITAIDCHQIQDISSKSAIAEGIIDRSPFGFSAFGIDQSEASIAAFEYLWKQVNGDQSWSDNIWVFAYTFEYLFTKL